MSTFKKIKNESHGYTNHYTFIHQLILYRNVSRGDKVSRAGPSTTQGLPLGQIGIKFIRNVIKDRWTTRRAHYRLQEPLGKFNL